ncbi:fatty acid-binding protein, brain-like isoform X2 [Ostrea edulis]|uniref:fatty acid-binding protein, brain-like isoform X2 n=1 Tax=Ostrea edulis TaxID=37623 RepID=UPI0024AED7E4|nr:fatty acid-binding protein, brain-like isoform X2 [Ostrea edulis]
MAGIQQFVGSWEETTKEGFEEMASALGLPPEKKQMYSDAKTTISYAISGDSVTINVGLVGVPGSRQFTFKLGEPYDSADLDGSPMKSLVNLEGDKLIEKHTNNNLQGAEMNIQRWIDGQTMMVVQGTGRPNTGNIAIRT